MFNWEGIDRSKADTATGNQLIRNATFQVDGELRRRDGLAIAVAQSGNNIIGHYSPLTGYHAVFFTSAGAVVAEDV